MERKDFLHSKMPRSLRNLFAISTVLSGPTVKQLDGILCNKEIRHQDSTGLFYNPVLSICHFILASHRQATESTTQTGHTDGEWSSMGMICLVMRE